MPARELVGVAVNGLVLVEGLPGSGKSATAAGLARWLDGRGVPVEHVPEDTADHPVDLEQVAVLSTEQVLALASESPDTSRALLSAAERHGDAWLVRHALHPQLPPTLVDRLRAHDAYDGSVSPDVHSRVLTDCWRRFGGSAPGRVQVWECVLLQNPVCALVARGDQPTDVLARHVEGLVEAVRSHRPALVYLDAGDPRPVLEHAAAEQPAEWLESVVGYHTRQGLGLRRGLRGFDGYVEFMRHRREIELEVIEGLDLPTLVVPVDGRGDEQTEQVRAFVAGHLGLEGHRETAHAETGQVA